MVGSRFAILVLDSKIPSYNNLGTQNDMRQRGVSSVSMIPYYVLIWYQYGAVPTDMVNLGLDHYFKIIEFWHQDLRTLQTSTISFILGQIYESLQCAFEPTKGYNHHF